MKDERLMITAYEIDERTRVQIGYLDGHIEIDVDLPFPLSVIQSVATRSLSPEAVLRSVTAVNHALQMARDSQMR